MAWTLFCGTSDDMQTTARIPCCLAAWATALPWLPVEAATTPHCRCDGDKRATALVAPRNLKLPVVWWDSIFRWTGTPASADKLGECAMGVRSTKPARLCRARKTSFRQRVVIGALCGSKDNLTDRKSTRLNSSH